VRRTKVIEFSSSVRFIPLLPSSTMPPPSNENELKRLARRRLIGAVALTLLAVIVLPLLLEDEPPPASSLAVHMAASPQPALDQADQAAQPDPTDAPDVAAAPVPPTTPRPAPLPAPPVEPAKPAPKPAAAKAEPVKVAAVKPVSAAPSKPAAKPAPQVRSAAVSGAFVVQLAALSDSAKAQALKARAAEAGMPAYTDRVGTLTRVRVGPYPSREAAVAAELKLAENGMSGQILAK
jgi:DedD protein